MRTGRAVLRLSSMGFLVEASAKDIGSRLKPRRLQNDFLLEPHKTTLSPYLVSALPSRSAPQVSSLTTRWSGPGLGDQIGWNQFCRAAQLAAVMWQHQSRTVCAQ